MTLLKEIVKSHKKKVSINKIKTVLNRIKTEIKNKNIDADVILGGSVAKNTNLKKYDCDIFIRFSKKYKDRSLSELLEKVLIFPKIQKVHGSRDYFRFVYQGTEFEVIPVLAIKKAEQALNVTDVSPLHVKWVQKHIKNKADDVRLAKLFCQAQRLYGAESYIGGFSGYMLEILVIYYGSFIKLLKAASKWKPKVMIDYSRFYKNQKEISHKVNRAKLDSPIILIDPVQKDRNAAAALNKDIFEKFIVTAKAYLGNPSKKFFRESRFSLSKVRAEARKSKAELILIKVEPLEGKRDVVGGKILKCYNHVKKQLILNEFELLDSDWFWKEGKEGLIWFMVFPKILPNFRKHAGPMVYSKKNDINKFIKKHKKYKVEGNRMYSKVRRKYKSPVKLVKDLMKIYFKDKVKRKRLIK